MSEQQTPSDAADNADTIPTPSMVGLHVALRAVRPEDYQFIYAIETDPHNTLRWRWAGRTVSPEHAIGTLWEGALSLHLIVDRMSAEPLGFVNVFNADLVAGTAHFAILGRSDRRGSGMLLEAAALAIERAFAIWPLHKIYAEIHGANRDWIGPSFTKVARLEGRLDDHFRIGDSRFAKLIYAIYRDDWARFSERILKRYLASES